MNWINIRIIIKKNLIVIASVIFAIVLFNFFLFLENKSLPYEKVTYNINGIFYSFEKQTSKAFASDKLTNSKKKLYVVGDSFVAGITCAAKNENLTGHLSNILPDLEVINLGVPGKDPSNYIDFLNYFPIDTGDIVAVVLYDNDIHMSMETCSLSFRQKEYYPLYLPSFCKNYLIDAEESKDKKGVLRKINSKLKDNATFSLIKQGLYNLPYFNKFFYKTEFLSRWNNYEADENKWIRSSILVMKQIIESRGGRFELFYYPNTNSIKSSDPRHKIWREFSSKIQKDYGIVINDPYPFFLKVAPRERMVWSLIDGHPSCDAHEIMARFMSQIVQKNLVYAVK